MTIKRIGYKWPFSVFKNEENFLARRLVGPFIHFRTVDRHLLNKSTFFTATVPNNQIWSYTDLSPIDPFVMSPKKIAHFTASVSTPLPHRTRGQTRNNPTSVDKAAVEEAEK